MSSEIQPSVESDTTATTVSELNVSLDDKSIHTDTNINVSLSTNTTTSTSTAAPIPTPTPTPATASTPVSASTPASAHTPTSTPTSAPKAKSQPVIVAKVQSKTQSKTPSKTQSKITSDQKHIVSKPTTHTTSRLPASVKKTILHTQRAAAPVISKVARAAAETAFILQYWHLSKLAGDHSKISSPSDYRKFKRGQWYCNSSYFAIPELQQYNHVNVLQHPAELRYLTKEDESTDDPIRSLDTVTSYVSQLQATAKYSPTISKPLSDTVQTSLVQTKQSIDECCTKFLTNVSDTDRKTTDTKSATDTDIKPWKTLYDSASQYTTYRVFPCGHCFLDVALISRVFHHSDTLIRFEDQIKDVFQHCVMCDGEPYDYTNRLRMYSRPISLCPPGMIVDSHGPIVPRQYLAAIAHEVAIGDVVDTGGYHGMSLWIYEGHSKFLRVPVSGGWPDWPLDYLKLRGYAYYLNVTNEFQRLQLGNGLLLALANTNDTSINNDDDEDNESVSSDDTIKTQYRFFSESSSIKPDDVTSTEIDGWFTYNERRGQLKLNYTGTSPLDSKTMTLKTVFTKDPETSHFFVPAGFKLLDHRMTVHPVNLFLYSGYPFRIQLNANEYLEMEDLRVSIVKLNTRGKLVECWSSSTEDDD